MSGCKISPMMKQRVINGFFLEGIVGTPRNNSITLYSMAYMLLQPSWKANCMPQIKCFGWLLILDRLNTRDILQRRNFNVQIGVLCVMCDQGHRETRDQLFFKCDFAKQCWEVLDITWTGNPRIHERWRPNSCQPVCFSWMFFRLQHGSFGNSRMRSSSMKSKGVFNFGDIVSKSNSTYDLGGLGRTNGCFSFNG